MQNQLERIQQMAGMQRNFLRDYMPTEASPNGIGTLEQEMFVPTSPLPDQMPLGMAYVPYQQWEEPYDADTAFPVGTMFPALDNPFRGGGSCAG